MICDFNKSDQKGENTNKKFCIINQIKTLKKEEIKLNHDDYLLEKYLN